jgi:hypothetical protein
MPICNTAAMNHHLCEIGSQVTAPRLARAGFAHAVVILDGCRLAPQPGPRGARQYHFVGAAAVQPGAQSGREDLAPPAQSLARQLGVFQPGGHKDACETAWDRFANNHGLVRSLRAVAWAAALPAL